MYEVVEESQELSIKLFDRKHSINLLKPQKQKMNKCHSCRRTQDLLDEQLKVDPAGLHFCSVECFERHLAKYAPSSNYKDESKKIFKRFKAVPNERPSGKRKK
jgi:hypothetical protein